MRTSPSKSVPFGPQAFIPGSLVHTNQIKVLLGDNWFVERSAKQASEIAGRRIKQCDKMLSDLHKEKEQFQNWISYTTEIQGDEDAVEIMEEYNPEKEKIWREQHRKNVKAYHRQLAEERQKQKQTEENNLTQDENKLDINDDKELWAYLDVLEEQEDERNEMLESSEEEEKDVIKESSSSEDDAEDSDDKDEEKTKVRWKDVKTLRPNQITFSHTASESNVDEDLQETVHHRENENKTDLVNSPADIYKYFGVISKPKSILKTRSDQIEVKNETVMFPEHESVPIVNEEEMFPLPNYRHNSTSETKGLQQPSKTAEKTAFTGEIVEKSKNSGDVVNPEESPMARPLSRFKAQRKGMNR
ncbi:unconventional prefoldin RPB5 interactor 1-like isoform X2 [Limulus polyphemus]|uniref:Unconventional prefoldin RPB5 interactor 1-like isoform X2 n=1 Tax=Limulus polyphemus TaxID=6850 RepID=A0ABM1SYF2_LIMPO|nr:unconventional prefoldin RPB5 interactor 1-like isoform X2 [Limulus polyphemus]XP_022248658.1 unconventional prefoldin RPB5 interactor 1-like isoform X2 [Limulus polyphemus]XP_022248659.1 unconventional prefoldin RPB5 interactor 1-like isoform X2 [Limulus polyphemus]